MQSGRIDDQYAAMVVDDAAVERGLRDRTLVEDTRLRDALRALRLAPEREGARRYALPGEAGPQLDFSPAPAADEAAYAVEAAALGEADAVRIQRRVDALEQRLGALEAR